jgi:hypothetical protein
VSVGFDQFWSEVIRKEPSRAKAHEAWNKARQRGASAEEIIAGLRRWLPVWRALDDPTKIPYITTWLNQERWTVEDPVAPVGNGRGRHDPNDGLIQPSDAVWERLERERQAREHA